MVRALEAAAEPERAPRDTSADPIEPPTWAQSRADALVRVAEAALGDGLAGKSPDGDRYQVVVHVDADALREAADDKAAADQAANGQSVLADGIRVSAETSRRIACDSHRVTIASGKNGQALDVGRRSRTIPASIRRALEHRDSGCRFPGCTNRRCDAHHVHHWADGGATRIDNLLSLCRRHHRAVHEDGFFVQLGPNGAARFRSPSGRWIEPCPKARLGPDPVGALVADHTARGLAIDHETALSGWDGSRLDLGFAVDGLRGSGDAAQLRGPNVSAETPGGIFGSLRQGEVESHP